MVSQQTSFLWTQGVRKSAQLLPIDYTNKEFAALIEATTRDTKRVIFNNPWIRSVLYELIVSDTRKAIPPEIKQATPPLPLEAAVFLDCFYQLARNHEYSEYFENPTLVAPKSTMNRFINDLCKKLYKMVGPNSEKFQTNISQFYLHTLFQNTRFVDVMLGELWDEIEPRFQKMRVLAKTAPADLQMCVLENCLVFLDSNLLNLAICSQPAMTDQIQQQKEDLQQLLRDLLSYRVKQDSTNIYAQYKIDNDRLPDGSTMEQAFDELKRKSENKELKDAARDTFLASLKRKSEHRRKKLRSDEIDIEGRYLGFTKYLSATSPDMDNEVLDEFITDCCKQQCRQLMKTLLYNPISALTEAIPQSTYASNLIDRLVREYINQQLSKFGNIIQLFVFYNTACTGSALQDTHTTGKLVWFEKESGQYGIVDALANTVQLIDPLANTYYANLLQLGSCLQHTWDFIHAGNFPIIDASTHSFICRKDVSAKLLFATNAAIQYFEFEKDDLKVAPFQDIDKWLIRYETLIADASLLYSPADYLGITSKLLLMALILILHKVVLDAKPVITEHIRTILNLL